MLLKKLSYYLTRIKQLGPQGLKKTLHHRFTKKMFASRMKKKALNHNASTTWQQLTKKHNLTPDFANFFTRLKTQTFLHKIFTAPDFTIFVPHEYFDKEELISKADAYITNSFDILGSGPQSFTTNIPWQHDFKTEKQELNNQSETFYQEVKLPPPSKDFTSYSPDIKVPWELSRLQHLFILGAAFQQTNDQRYSASFVSQVTGWMEKNPYLLGVNWVCPMEVGIRAINLMWGFHFFKHDETISLEFWENLVCSLVDHATFLEHNWEWSDKPNNHYLADLIGALYLNTFLQEIPHFKQQQRTNVATFLEQIEHQIQADGTSYEGSTAYHKLVTEMYLHFILLCKAEKIELKPSVKQRFSKMILFLSDCTDAFGNFVTIGDDDSGKIVTGIKVDDFFRVACCAHRHEEAHSKNKPHGTMYPDFGLTVIKQQSWHITFKQTHYKPSQPSGHFHHDGLSVTLSIAGQPILVDAGSYLYTANNAWRNHFRSWQSHNTFYLPDYQNDLNQSDLFQLPLIPTDNQPVVTQNDTTIAVHGIDKHYTHQGIIMHRALTFNGDTEKLELEDWIEQNLNNNHHNGSWTLLFHPDIEIVAESDGTWIIAHAGKQLAQIESTLPFTLEEARYSPRYGEIRATKSLRATTPLSEKNRAQTIIQRLR